ncbi:MAG: RpiB/LacA/LacB family sugar-phosphate isomerase [Bacteroidota bacterium]
MPSRFVREDDAEKMVATFISASFEGGRHEKRVGKIACS